MPNKLKIEVNQQDYQALISKFERMNKYASKEIGEALQHNAKIVVEEMKREVPVDTGRLKRNIYYLSSGKSATIASEAVHKGYDYAPVIENYGGRYKRGMHYFTNAVLRFRDRVVKQLETGIKSIITSKSGSTRQQGKVRTFTPRK